MYIGYNHRLRCLLLPSLQTLGADIFAHSLLFVEISITLREFGPSNRVFKTSLGHFSCRAYTGHLSIVAVFKAFVQVDRCILPTCDLLLLVGCISMLAFDGVSASLVEELFPCLGEAVLLPVFEDLLTIEWDFNRCHSHVKYRVLTTFRVLIVNRESPLLLLPSFII